MTLNSYEVTCILRPDVTDAVSLEFTNSCHSFIGKHGGQHILIQHQGRKHLSYNIMHYYDGTYIRISYSGNGYLVQLIEKYMRLNDSILRYLTIKTN